MNNFVVRAGPTKEFANLSDYHNSRKKRNYTEKSTVDIGQSACVCISTSLCNYTLCRRVLLCCVVQSSTYSFLYDMIRSTRREGTQVKWASRVNIAKLWIWKIFRQRWENWGLSIFRRKMECLILFYSFFYFFYAGGDRRRNTRGTNAWGRELRQEVGGEGGITVPSNVQKTVPWETFEEFSRDCPAVDIPKKIPRWEVKRKIYITEYSEERSLSNVPRTSGRGFTCFVVNTKYPLLHFIAPCPVHP